MIDDARGCVDIVKDAVGANGQVLQLVADRDIGVADELDLPTGQNRAAKLPGGKHCGEAEKPGLQPELPRWVPGE